MTIFSINLIPILYQDDVGGFHSKTKERDWINCEPLVGSFFVGINDYL